jgi:hypothetical protein
MAETCNLASHADQRVFGRQVAVVRWKQRGSLDVGIGVRIANGYTEQVNAESAEHVEQRQRFGQLRKNGVVHAVGLLSFFAHQMHTILALMHSKCTPFWP